MLLRNLETGMGLVNRALGYVTRIQFQKIAIQHLGSLIIYMFLQHSLL